MAPAASARALTGAVLAGGRGRRMGTDKASLSIGGRSLLERAVATLALVCDDVLVVVRAGQQLDPPPPARVVRDRVREGGPLAGLDAALSARAGELLVVIPVDMPAVSPDLLRLLDQVVRGDATADAAVLRTARGLEPFPMVVRCGVAATAARLLDAGERRLGAFLECLNVREVPAVQWRMLDPVGRWALNLNAPADLALAGAGVARS